MKFAHHSKLQVHDLYLFIGGKLADACKSWGVPAEFSKTEFDHSKVYDMNSAMEHEEEVSEYLKYDVVSLAHLFKIYHTTMWKCFSVDMNLCVSPAQFAVKAWSGGNDYCAKIYVPHKGKEEDDDRAAYYGGRVMCQYKGYESTDFDEKQLSYYYDQIEDYLVLGDVNSLYPAAQMFNQYAYGRWKYIEGNEEYLDRLIRRHPDDQDWLLRTCFCVDVTCPKDLMTSFLMERDSKGNIVHDLHDKVKQWYWGCEIEEAIVLGYVVTKIHEMKTFSNRDYIFKDYVSKCWQGRQRTLKGSAQNLCFKFAMNSLTGKFGQRSFDTNRAIYSTDHEPSKKMEQNFQEMLSRVVDFQPIFTAEGYNSAIMLDIENEQKGPRYPIYLSAQILAYARVHMSKIMRAGQCYRHWCRAIYYTDTDSLLMPSECLPDLEKAGFIGDELGQLKCDLTDSTDPQTFARIVRGIWSATKGPYSLLYVKPGDGNLWEKVRVKGIMLYDSLVVVTSLFSRHSTPFKTLALP